MDARKQEMLAAQQNPEEEEEEIPCDMYLAPTFKEYVTEKYSVKDNKILENPQILKMIYAVEWYDIPRSAYSDLVEFHPYLSL